MGPVHDPGATVVWGQALPCRMRPSPGHAGAQIPQKIVVHGTAWGLHPSPPNLWVLGSPTPSGTPKQQ